MLHTRVKPPSCQSRRLLAAVGTLTLLGCLALLGTLIEQQRRQEPTETDWVDQRDAFVERVQATGEGVHLTHVVLSGEEVHTLLKSPGEALALRKHLIQKFGSSEQLMDADDDEDHAHGHANGRLGREYLRLQAKALADAAAVAVVYSVATYPGCTPYANGASLPEWIMHFHSYGRIHPLGSFDDSEASKEYFLLACPVDTLPLNSQVRVTRVTFPHLTAWDNLVWIENLIELEIPEPAPGAPPFKFNHTHIGYFVMDTNSSICGYKILFQRLEQRDPPAETMTDAALNAQIASFCNNIVQECVNSTAPPEHKYTSVQACIDFNSVPARKQRWGYKDADQDSLRCRTFHRGLVTQNIARNLPDHVAKHCGHSGPTGFSKCVPHSFASFFTDVIQCQA